VKYAARQNSSGRKAAHLGALSALAVARQHLGSLAKVTACLESEPGSYRFVGRISVDDAARDIVLIRVSRFEKRNHGVSLGGAICDGIVGKDDAMDENYSLLFLGLDANAIVNEDGTGSWSRAGKKLLLTWHRAHGFLACPILNQIEKRTGLGPHPTLEKTPILAAL
jgi:hypothetical protein